MQNLSFTQCRFPIVLFVILSLSWPSYAQKHIPQCFISSFNWQKLQNRYELLQKVKPAFLKADFNGDGNEDIVTLVKDKLNKKTGLLLIHGGTQKVKVFGAGHMLGKPGFDETDDLKWIDGWKLYTNKIAYETKFNNGDIVGSIKRKLSHPAISIWQNMDGSPLAGGLIVWNGKQYGWIHEGE